mmetsp:Transcript_10314/g.11375  ORF Transcript_10314/g.11375 Transcript_10314/m.11375 type:complete len:138 (-) Transcript_10314:41-454(-)
MALFINCFTYAIQLLISFLDLLNQYALPTSANIEQHHKPPKKRSKSIKKSRDRNEAKKTKQETKHTEIDATSVVKPNVTREMSREPRQSSKSADSKKGKLKRFFLKKKKKHIVFIGKTSVEVASHTYKSIARQKKGL